MKRKLKAIVTVIEVTGILAGFVAFIAEFGYHKLEERTSRSWQLLTTEAPGNSGKIEALEYLNRQRIPDFLVWLPFFKKQVSLRGIDLSPPILSEWKKQALSKEREEIEWCSQHTYLRGVRLSQADLSWASLACSDLEGANLRGAILGHTDLRRARLEGADLREVNLKNADLRRASLIDADLRGAILPSFPDQGPLIAAKLKGANLLRADLRQINGLDCEGLKQAQNWSYAYRDEDLGCGEVRPES